ncbi:alpha-1,3-galactosyltransferase 2-like [Salvelinus alpinus]
MRVLYKAKRVLTCAGCASVLLFIAYIIPTSIRYLEGLIPMNRCHLAPGEKLKLGNSIDASLDLWSRGDVQTCTDWGAPVIWDGMFDPDHYDQEHRRNHSSVSLTVFAVGRYLDAYLEAFLLSAERHFMVALPVTYYVFTDVPERVPNIQLGPGRSLKVVRVQRHSRWQDISMMRMRAIADAIESQIRRYSRYVFCFDVDQVFVGRFGSEALGDSVALLHAYYYHRPQSLYTYDRNPRSRAYMETGDFYYHAAVFGGSWQTVKNMTETCYQTIMEDKENQVEALWHDESHLNKYLWLHKPSRVLSPEYCWSSDIGYRGDIHVTRMLWAKKKYDTLRITELCLAPSSPVG